MNAIAAASRLAPARSRAPIAVALFNDTGDQPHVGCLAVSAAHRQMLRRAGAVVRHAFFTRDWLHLAGESVNSSIDRALCSPEILRVLADVSAVVVNGEGTIHHGYGRHLLGILGAAQQLRIPAYLVNAVLQDVGDARDVLGNLDDCTVRDRRSSACLASLGIAHRLVPDSFFEAEFDNVPVHEFSGALVITDCHPDRAAEFRPSLDALRAAWRGRVADYALEAAERVTDWRHAVADVRCAAVVVTGRHHGACLALRAGVPFVTLPSNTWKIEGLIELLDGYPPAAADATRPLFERVKAALEAREWFASTASRWRQRECLDTFGRLAGRRVRLEKGLPLRPNPVTIDAVKYLARPAGRVLHCGSGDGALVRALLADAIDSHGVDAGPPPAGPAASRLSQAAFDALPFANGQFQTVVVDQAWLEHLEPDELDAAIAELERIAGGTVVVETSHRPSRAEMAACRARGREWWEQRFFERQFRRHTRALAVTDYESLESEATGSVLLFQKLPPSAAVRHSLASLRAEPDLHMDMLRETGRRADAHLARYEWARQWVKPGDTVVDAACGLGYGSALLWDGSEAARVVGIDVTDTAVAYARDNFMPGRPGVEFRVSDAEAWQGWPDASVDCVVSFETIEHLADPIRFMTGVQRVLKPGGRFLCSVPNMWVDETGRDPNPHHLHVFDLDRLTGLVSSVLLVDEVYAQSAGGHAARFARRRLLRSIAWPERDSELVSGAEWLLLSGIKDPLCGTAAPYVEQVFPAPVGREPNAVAFARDYVNPWAVHALVMGSFRVRSPRLLSQLARRWLAASPPRSADAGAALCVLAYRALEGDAASDVVRLIGDIREYCDGSPLNPQARRWQVSLRFVRGKLHLHRGELAEAERCLRACAAEDASAFTPHLETKTTEAAWLAGRLALERGDAATAAADWSVVSEALGRLKAVPVRDWLVSPERPAAFERGDGLREIACAVDNAALSGNALRRLRDPSGAWRPGPDPVDRNFQRNTAHLLETVRRRGGEIAALRAEVERGRVELQPVHEQWKATREALHDVTRRLHAALGTRENEADSTSGSRWKAENAALRATLARLLRGGNGTDAEHPRIDARALATIQTQWDRLPHAPPQRREGCSPARVGIFGTGEAAMKVWEALAGLDEADVVWFADNDARQQGRRLLWIDVIAPGDIPAHGCDAVVVGSMSRDAIRSQLLNLGIPAGRILTPDVQQSVLAIRAALRQFLSVAQRQ